MNGALYRRAGGELKESMYRSGRYPNQQQTEFIYLLDAFLLFRRLIMKRNFVDCPVCGRRFNPKSPMPHIQDYHKNATNNELVKIRDARRYCFGNPHPTKQVSNSVLPSMSLYSAGYRKNVKILDSNESTARY